MEEEKTGVDFLTHVNNFDTKKKIDTVVEAQVFVHGICESVCNQLYKTSLGSPVVV